MEIQEFAPRHLIAQLAFQQNQSAVIDRRGALAAELHEKLGTASASLEETAAEATTRDGMSKYRIGMAQLLAALHVDGLDGEDEKIEAFFRLGMDLLDSPPLTRVVAHTSDVAAVPSFEELRDAMMENLSSSPSRVRDAVGVPLSDVGLHYDFRDDSRIVEVRIGPMHDEELRKVFDAPDTAVFPAASLFIDVKMVARVGDSKNDSLDLWASALKRNRQIANNLSTWLRETLDES